MAIEVKSGGAVGATALAGFVGGQGRRQVDDAKLALNAINTGLGRQAVSARAFHGRVAAAGRQKTAIEARADEADQEFTRAFDVREDQARIREEGRVADAGRRREELGVRDDLRTTREAGQQSVAEETRISDQKRKRDDLEFSLSAKQRSEFNNLSDSYDEAVASGEYSDDELSEIRQKIRAKQLGIKPQPRLKSSSKYPEGKQPGDVFTEETLGGAGALFTRDDKGNVKKLLDNKPREIVKPLDVGGLQQQAVALFTNEEGVTNWKKVDDYVDRAVKRHATISGTGEELAAGVVPPPAVVEEPVLDEAQKALMLRSGLDPNNPKQVAAFRSVTNKEATDRTGQGESEESLQPSGMVLVKQKNGAYTMVAQNEADLLIQKGGEQIPFKTETKIDKPAQTVTATQDEEAIEWARNNPGDKANEILRMNGVE